LVALWFHDPTVLHTNTVHKASCLLTVKCCGLSAFAQTLAPGIWGRKKLYLAGECECRYTLFIITEKKVVGGMILF
jgi:hypothetical protein